MSKRKVFPLSIYKKNPYKPHYMGIYDPLMTVFFKLKIKPVK